jgi:D-alanine-D-alanine ligase-like ATP-grasp enzyme
VSFKICVLQPSYEGSVVDYGKYDRARDLGTLLPGSFVEHVFLRKATVFHQLREQRRRGFDVFVNLCEGDLDWDIPSVDVIHALDRLALPYTGPTASLYDPTKDLMKRVARHAGVAVPESVLARSAEDVARAATTLRFPLFVKRNHGGESIGIDEDSICADGAQLTRRAQAIMDEFDEAMIDEYIAGREFSVLVCASPDPGGDPIALRPLEFVFPSGVRFKTYLLKAASYLPDSNVPVTDAALDQQLREAGLAVFRGFEGVGYCRMDFRLGEDGIVRLIDVNFTCSVFYAEGSYGTADYILAHDGLGQSGFLRRIIDEGLARHRRAREAPALSGHARNGNGAARSS